MVTTVTGEIPDAQLGWTLAHEHLYCDISVHSGSEDNRMTDVGLVAEELADFLSAGGKTIIEVTPVGIGRDPAKLREISRLSGAQIVSGIAFYDQSTYPEWVRTADVDAIADFLVRELEEGTDGVRAGLIGELMSHNEPAPNARHYQLEEAERRVFVAAARAQRRTGAAISTHASLGRAGHAQLDVLERAGADLSRVVIGHCDAHWHCDIEQDLAYYLPILTRGARCQFDLIGWTQFASDEVRADRISALVKLGFAEKVMLSTDTCRMSQLRRRGGRGYAYLERSFLPLLSERGVNEFQIRAMMIDAPRTLLARN